MDYKIGNEARYNPGGTLISERDTAAASNIITMFILKGKSPEEIMGILDDALAQMFVLFSPSLEDARKNLEGASASVLECVEKNFPNQAELTKSFEDRVNRLAPKALALETLIGLAKEAKSGPFV